MWDPARDGVFGDDTRVRTLYLLRHAKSSWDDPALADRDRPLAPRGRRAAELMKEHLTQDGIVPALVLCSAARRTRETLDVIAPAFGAEADIEVERDLYGASAGELLERLQGVPDTISSVMLIGHNPSVQTLALNLAGSGELDAIALKYPTGALATLTFEGAWQELDRGAAELTGFVRPRDLG
jgi:phosphohistidine phosphatase